MWEQISHSTLNYHSKELILSNIVIFGLAVASISIPDLGVAFYGHDGQAIDPAA